MEQNGGDGVIMPQTPLIEVAPTLGVRVLGSLEDVATTGSGALVEPVAVAKLATVAELVAAADSFAAAEPAAAVSPASASERTVASVSASAEASVAADAADAAGTTAVGSHECAVVRQQACCSTCASPHGSDSGRRRQPGVSQMWITLGVGVGRAA